VPSAKSTRNDSDEPPRFSFMRTARCLRMGSSNISSDMPRNVPDVSSAERTPEPAAGSPPAWVRSPADSPDGSCLRASADGWASSGERAPDHDRSSAARVVRSACPPPYPIPASSAAASTASAAT
jgi:hypothetical protein